MRLLLALVLAALVVVLLWQKRQQGGDFGGVEALLVCCCVAQLGEQPGCSALLQVFRVVVLDRSVSWRCVETEVALTACTWQFGQLEVTQRLHSGARTHWQASNTLCVGGLTAVGEGSQQLMQHSQGMVWRGQHKVACYGSNCAVTGSTKLALLCCVEYSCLCQAPRHRAPAHSTMHAAGPTSVCLIVGMSAYLSMLRLSRCHVTSTCARCNRCHNLSVTWIVSESVPLDAYGVQAQPGSARRHSKMCDCRPTG